MKIIKLTQGKETMVDDEDYDQLMKHKWCYVNNGYARGRVNGRQVYIHRMIMGYPKNNIDHIDNNSLNNQKGNLRICSQKQNTQNRIKNKNNTTGYKGVIKMVNNKYKSRISYEGKRIILGSFNTPQEAHLKYIEKAKELYGEFYNPG